MSQATMDIREMALRKGKTTRDAGVTQSYFIDLCLGRKRAGANAINKIAEALGYTTDEVFDGIEESARRAKTRRGRR